MVPRTRFFPARFPACEIAYGISSPATSLPVLETLLDWMASVSSARSLGSGSSFRRRTSPVTRSFKQARELFLTRRLVEALDIIEPIITPPKPTRSDHEGQDETNGVSSAAIATADGKDRIRIWNLYITILNAAIELGVESGAKQFGKQRWKALASKARDGTVWDEVIEAGYGGYDGNVDVEVVSNLGTLLLSHSPSQEKNQQYLESYMAASADVSEPPQAPEKQEKGRQEPRGRSARSVQERVKLIELFTLHVLPRNREWQYARDFISMAELLDEEQKEEMLLALQGLQLQEKSRSHLGSDVSTVKPKDYFQEKDRRYRDEQSEAVHSQTTEDQANSRGVNNEHDFGIDDSTHQPPTKAVGQEHSQERPQERAPRKSRASIGPKQPKPKKPPTSAQKRNSMLLNIFSRLLAALTRSLRDHPAAIMRLALIALAFIVALRQHAIRARLDQMTAVGWEKLRKTLGMGVKVSYI